MSRKIILIKQELLLLVYELNRSGLLAENEKIRPDRKSGSAGMPRPSSYAVLCLKKKRGTGPDSRVRRAPIGASYSHSTFDGRVGDYGCRSAGWGSVTLCNC